MKPKKIMGKGWATPYLTPIGYTGSRYSQDMDIGFRMIRGVR